MLFILDSITVAATGSVTARVAKELMKRLKSVSYTHLIRQIDLGGDKSGALSGNIKTKNTPEKVADNIAGEWNTVYVKVLNDRVTVSVNGVVTATNVILENSCDRNIPAYVKGQLMLIGEGTPVEYREMYILSLIHIW